MRVEGCEAATETCESASSSSSDAGDGTALAADVSDGSGELEFSAASAATAGNGGGNGGSNGNGSSNGNGNGSSSSSKMAQYSIQALAVLAELLAPLQDLIFPNEDKERVIPLLTSLLANVVPYLKHHRWFYWVYWFFLGLLVIDLSFPAFFFFSS